MILTYRVSAATAMCVASFLHPDRSACITAGPTRVDAGRASQKRRARMRPKEVEMSEETRKRVEAARDALFALEELLPIDDATRARLYALRVTFGNIAGQLITRGPPSEAPDMMPRCVQCGLRTMCGRRDEQGGAVCGDWPSCQPMTPGMAR